MSADISSQVPQPAVHPPRRLLKTLAIGGVVFALFALATLGIRETQKEFLQEVSVETSLAPQQTADAKETTRALGAMALKGKAASDFSLQEISGTSIRLFALRGSPVILLFFASWNEASVEAARTLNAIYEEKKLGLHTSVFAVDTLEPLDAARNLRARAKFTVSMLADADGSVAEAYGITALPTFIFIGEDGIVQEAVIGPMREEDVTVQGLELSTQAPS